MTLLTLLASSFDCDDPPTFKTVCLKRMVKGIFVTRDRPFFFPVKCEMANFFHVNRDFHSSREA